MTVLRVFFAATLVLAVVHIAAAPASPSRKSTRPTPAEGSIPRQAASASTAEAQARDLLDLGASPQAVARAQAIPSRREVINSLLRSGASKGEVEQLAAAKGMSATQLRSRSLSGTSLSSASALSVASGTQAVAANLPRYDELNWDAGLSFTPVVASPLFKLGPKIHKVAALGCFGLRTGGVLGLSEMYRQNVLRIDQSAGGEIIMWVDIPDGSSTYAISIKLVPRGGGTFFQWLGARPPDSKLDLDVSTGIFGSARTFSINPLLDGTGAVGLFRVNPFSMPYSRDQLSDLRMRRINCKLRVSINFRPDDDDLLFGGIKIEQL